MRINRLQNALHTLSAALRETEAALVEMWAESDPLAVHIFVSRRQYRRTPDTKGGRRHETAARLSYQAACDLGFQGSLDDWERLLGAMPRR